MQARGNHRKIEVDVNWTAAGLRADVRGKKVSREGPPTRGKPDRLEPNPGEPGAQAFIEPRHKGACLEFGVDCRQLVNYSSANTFPHMVF